MSILIACMYCPPKTYSQQTGNKLFVTVASVQLNVPEKTVIGKINGSSQKLDSKKIKRYLGTVNNLDHKIINEFDKSDINCFSELQNYDNISPAIKPKLILKAVITAINFNLKGKYLLKDLAGPCSITCQWQIYTVDDKLVPKNSIVEETRIERKKDDYDLILNDLIAASTQQLLKNNTLLKYLNTYLENYLNNLPATAIDIPGCNAGTESNSRDLLKHAMSSVVTVIGSSDFGSGTIISSDGYILTNFHVTNGEKNLKIKTYRGETLEASLVKSNIDYDIALLKVDEKKFSCMPMANNYVPEPGDNIYAVGTPLDQQFGQSVSKGIISGIRKINGVSFIQTDVSLNSGNSGGPVLNENGQIIGIVTMKMSGRGIEGIGFCLALNEITRALNLELKH